MNHLSSNSAILSLHSLLREQNETAASLDQVAIESGDPFAYAQRRYAGPLIGGKVLLINMIIRQREALEDPDRRDRNFATIEIIDWEEALAIGQPTKHDAIRVVLDWHEEVGDYRIRLDEQVVGPPTAFEGIQQSVAMIMAEAIRRDGRISKIAYGDPGWERQIHSIACLAEDRGNFVFKAMSQ